MTCRRRDAIGTLILEQLLTWIFSPNHITVSSILWESRHQNEVNSIKVHAQHSGHTHALCHQESMTKKGFALESSLKIQYAENQRSKGELSVRFLMPPYGSYTNGIP
eukprot:569998-Amphidinium_carterae.2